jgi:hypothetical protein
MLSYVLMSELLEAIGHIDTIVSPSSISERGITSSYFVAWALTISLRCVRNDERTKSFASLLTSSSTPLTIEGLWIVLLDEWESPIFDGAWGEIILPLECLQTNLKMTKTLFREFVFDLDKCILHSFIRVFEMTCSSGLIFLYPCAWSFCKPPDEDIKTEIEMSSISFYSSIQSCYSGVRSLLIQFFWFHWNPKRLDTPVEFSESRLIIFSDNCFSNIPSFPRQVGQTPSISFKNSYVCSK